MSTELMSASRFRANFSGVEYVFLDRDGVILKKLKEGQYLGSWDRAELIEGAADAISQLNDSGRTVILITNQRGIALGCMSEGDLNEVHRRMLHVLAEKGAVINSFYYCPHDESQCDCRKPAPGMIRKAFEDHCGAGALNSVMIGDSISDIKAGIAVGMRTIFVRGPVPTSKPGADEAQTLADAVVSSLAEAVQLLLP